MSPLDVPAGILAIGAAVVSVVAFAGLVVVWVVQDVRRAYRRAGR